MQKVFRRALTALLIVTCVLTAAIVGATVKLYTATAEDYANEVESQDIAKLRARDKAIKKATKQAGVYLQNYSRSVNSELTDDEILAITSNAWQLVGEPKYTRTLKQISDETTIIVWTASVEVNVDDAEIKSWLKRDDKDKSTIISQTREAQKVAEENDKKIEDLREKYNRATSQAEKDNIIKQMNDADRDFLANQKLEEGLKLHYKENYNSAIKLYNEALQLNPNLWYAKAKLLLLTSDFEGFGLVLVEAMASGCVPVALGSYPAVFDIVRDGAGIVVQMPYDESRFAADVESLMNNENRRSDMAIAAKSVAETFSVSSVVDKYERLFLSLGIDV